jgi:hypothetical protein
MLERLREDLRLFGNAKAELYSRIDSLLRELANPNLHEVNLTTAFKIELWDRYGRDHLRMVIAATSSVEIASGGFRCSGPTICQRTPDTAQGRDGASEA